MLKNLLIEKIISIYLLESNLVLVKISFTFPLLDRILANHFSSVFQKVMISLQTLFSNIKSFENIFCFQLNIILMKIFFKKTFAEPKN